MKSHFEFTCICGQQQIARVEDRQTTCPNCKRKADIEWFRPLKDTQKGGK